MINPKLRLNNLDNLVVNPLGANPGSTYMDRQAIQAMSDRIDVIITAMSDLDPTIEMTDASLVDDRLYNCTCEYRIDSKHWIGFGHPNTFKYFSQIFWQIDECCYNISIDTARIKRSDGNCSIGNFRDNLTAIKSGLSKRLTDAVDATNKFDIEAKMSKLTDILFALKPSIEVLEFVLNDGKILSCNMSAKDFASIKSSISDKKFQSYLRSLFPVTYELCLADKKEFVQAYRIQYLKDRFKRRTTHEKTPMEVLRIVSENPELKGFF